MGLDDRDYMRERNRKIFNAEHARYRPPTPRRESSTLFIVLFWLALAFAAYKGYAWWQDKQARERVARQEAIARAYEAGRAAQATQQPAASSRFEAPSRPRPMESPTPMAPPEQAETGGTIYLCKSYDGRTFWAQAHCSKHRALIDSIVPVPRGVPFEQQVEAANRNRQDQARTLQAEMTFSHASPAVETKGVCKQLDALVDRLDSLARQPLPASEQDRMRAERKSARDQQFRMRC